MFLGSLFSCCSILKLLNNGFIGTKNYNLRVPIDDAGRCIGYNGAFVTILGN